MTACDGPIAPALPPLAAPFHADAPMPRTDGPRARRRTRVAAPSKCRRRSRACRAGVEGGAESASDMDRTCAARGRARCRIGRAAAAGPFISSRRWSLPPAWRAVMWSSERLSLPGTAPRRCRPSPPRSSHPSARAGRRADAPAAEAKPRRRACRRRRSPPVAVTAEPPRPSSRAATDARPRRRSGTAESHRGDTPPRAARCEPPNRAPARPDPLLRAPRDRVASVAGS